VKVKYLHYTKSMQESCLRLTGKKLLVSVALEGKFVSHGLHSLEDDDDMLTAVARELIRERMSVSALTPCGNRCRPSVHLPSQRRPATNPLRHR
jgi:hypothetical protein